jgi:thiazole synthase
MQRSCFCGATGKRSLETNWLKLEIHPDPKYLMPDAIETLKATEHWLNYFIVLPYIHADPVLCKHLEEGNSSSYAFRFARVIKD